MNVGTGPRSERAEHTIRRAPAVLLLADLGVSLDISVLDGPAFDQALGDGGFDIAFQEVAFRSTEDFRPLFASNGARNYGHYQNTELDRLFEQWPVDADLEKLRVVANQSQEILAEDCPWTFLFSLKNIAAVSNKIRNIRGENIDPEHFFTWAHEWWIPSEAQ